VKQDAKDVKVLRTHQHLTKKENDPTLILCQQKVTYPLIIIPSLGLVK